jgi:pimeloyl-ACP methyl ester carboxylesterase
MTFADFTPFRVATGGTEIFGLKGGSGAPLLLLHGDGQTHAIWGRCVAKLSAHFTVIATDLRGDGVLGEPAIEPAECTGRSGRSDGKPLLYSKRALAADLIEVMDHFGFGQFLICAQGLGAHVAHRLALDHPDAVDRLMLLGIAPALALFEGEWPERETVCPIDLEHDRADLERGHRVGCPLRILWGASGTVAARFDLIAQWRGVARDVSGRALHCGETLPEEAPEELVSQMLDFFAAVEPGELPRVRRTH